MSKRSRRRKAAMQKAPRAAPGSNVNTLGQVVTNNNRNGAAMSQAPKPAAGASQYADARPQQPPNSIRDVDPTEWYSPLQPITPYGPPNQTFPRSWDYQTGFNLELAPRQLSAFHMMRILSRTWSLLRDCIETRKDQMTRIPYEIQFKDKPKKESKSLDDLREFFRRPDRKNTFKRWKRLIMEDVLVIDAPALYVWPSQAGTPYAINVLDGASIKPLIDDAGRTPDFPNPGYQQMIKGLPMINLHERELLYRPMRGRTDMPVFGYSPVEQAAQLILTGIRRDLYQTNFFAEGSMPELIITVPETWCYSEDTEVLTRSGWKKFTEVSVEMDEFATRSPTGKFEWQKATGINLTHYSGEMISLQSRTIDCLVNPPHRVLISQHTDDYRTRVEKIMLAKDLLEEHHDGQRVPVTSTWAGGIEVDPHYFEHEQSNGPCDLNMTGDQFCAFMGAYLAEGWSNARSVSITQAEDGKAYSAYERLLADILGEEPRYSRDSFVIGNVPLANYVRQFGTASEKFIPREIMSAPARQVEIFLKFFTLGDGSAKGATLYTSSRRMADELQELVQKIGASATISADDRVGREIVFDDRRAMTNHVNYRVNISDSVVRRFSVDAQSYSGTIGCVSVPNGILYVRRNGKPCWSGNTPAQTAQFQGWFDSMMAGNQDLKSRVRFMPGGMQPFDIRNANGEALKAEFDEWIMLRIFHLFGLDPSTLKKQNNRAIAESAAKQAKEEGLTPYLDYFKDEIMDPLIQEAFGYKDMEFVWMPTPEVDPMVQMQVLSGYAKAGIRTRNEVRDELDLAPMPGGDELTLDTATGPIPIAEAIEANRAVALNKPNEINNQQEAHDINIAGQKKQQAQPEPKLPVNKAEVGETAVIPFLAKKARVAALAPMRHDTPTVVAASQTYRDKLSSFLRRAKTDAAAVARAQFGKLVKAGTDETGKALTTAIMQGVDWQILYDISDEQLAALMKLTGQQTLVTLGITDQEITDQVNELAVEMARTRAAEMVGMRIVLQNGAYHLIENPNAEWSITEPTRDAIRGAVEAAMANGDSAKMLADTIEGLDEFSPERAMMISRTELINANNQAHLAAFRESGVVEMKGWSTAGSDNVCDDCASNEANGPIPLDDVFPSGDLMPGAHPNCRCVLVPIMSLASGEDSGDGGGGGQQ